RDDFFAKNDIHLHVPAGATPKDGPSAGVAMVTALVSTLSGVPSRAGVAMTGEITLRGRVMPIGGLREKILAAHRAGIRDVIVPKDNQKDLVELPPEVKKTVKIHLVTTVDEALALALERPPKKRATGAGSGRSGAKKSVGKPKPIRPAKRAPGRPTVQ
ncbi:MAG: endopeptidase La, partial [Deltaproteobacteria bacterium]|nr:endopeptidase La [Deltaproteobacteria bacterium]